MGMLIRRHREGVDEVRVAMAEDVGGSLPTPPLVAGDTGVPPVGEDNPVPTEPAEEPTVYPPAVDHTGEEDQGSVEDTSVTSEPNSGTPGPEDADEPHDAIDDTPEGDAPVAAEEPKPELATVTAPTPVDAETPKRNASRTEWAEFLSIGPDDERSRDELANSYLGAAE